MSLATSSETTSIRSITLLLLLCLHSVVKSQPITAEEAYCFHTTINQCGQLMKQHQPEIVLQKLQKFDAVFLKKAGYAYKTSVYTLLATCQAQMGDTAKAFCYYLLTMNKQIIENASSASDPYYFLYRKYAFEFDSIYKGLKGDTLLRKRIAESGQKLDALIARDQSHLKGGYELSDKHKALKRADDSLNLLELIPILERDSNGFLLEHHYFDLYILFINLSGCNSLNYQKIVDYNNRYFGHYNALNLLLADLRLSTENNSVYYEHLFKSLQKPDLDFATIDHERRKLGQASLYFSYVANDLPIPEYYLENPVGPCD